MMGTRAGGGGSRSADLGGLLEVVHSHFNDLAHVEDPFLRLQPEPLRPQTESLEQLIACMQR